MFFLFFFHGYYAFSSFVHYLYRVSPPCGSGRGKLIQIRRDRIHNTAFRTTYKYEFAKIIQILISVWSGLGSGCDKLIQIRPSWIQNTVFLLKLGMGRRSSPCACAPGGAAQSSPDTSQCRSTRRYVARSEHPHDFLQSWGECVLLREVCSFLF